ncbi:MAG: hypothetical protein LBI29_01480 [Rickettsiales bacterium]|nr:hypothetical protein [Rickettsiales bacterium]
MGYKVRDTEKLSKNSFFTAAEQTVCPNPERLLVLEYRNVVKDKFTPENGKKPQEDDKNSKS